MAEPLVLYSVKNAVATVTLNRPASRNALTPELAAAVLEAMNKADKDPNVRALRCTLRWTSVLTVRRCASSS